jgi:3-methyladenine DNA glycosylase AlkD
MPRSAAKVAKPTPKRLAEETIAEMKRLADPKKAASYQRYFKEPVNWYGLDSATGKRLVKELTAKTKGVWTVADAVAFCNLMVRDPHIDPRGIAFQVVAAFVKDADASLIKDVRRWLEKSCGNWALVDNLAPSVVAPLLQRHPRLVAEVVKWTTSRNMWLRRASAVAFIPLVRQGEHLDTAYDVAKRLFGDKEDLMHKAVGWMLREVGKQDMKRLERFLRSEGPHIPRTTVRYAIERFPKEKGKELLEATRPS